MKSLRVVALMSLGLVVVDMSAATVTIFNRGSNKAFVAPKWEGHTNVYDSIEPGQSKSYDSGFYNIYGIRWAQKLPASLVQVPGQTNIKIFDTSLGLGWANTGAKLELLNDGSYSWMFGVQGSGNGAAKVVEDL